TAMSLKKNPAIFSPDIRRDVMKESPETAETPTETSVSEPVSGNGGTPDETAQNTASGTLAETPVSDVSELVKKTGLSRSTIYRYLRGQKVSTEVMQKIRQAMS
ncbi:MAG: helix-turn-helix domain-containing protein, partial [Candidatus Methanomethylicaceae archaeon]